MAIGDPRFRIVLSTGKGRFYWTGNISILTTHPTYGWSEDVRGARDYTERGARQIAEDIRQAIHPIFTDVVIAVEPVRGRMAEG